MKTADANRPLFVTGGTGYVGGHVLNLATSRRRSLLCLVRSEPETAIPGVEWVVGDLTTEGPWTQRLRDCLGVVHLATPSLGDCERDPDRAEALIVAGLRRLMDAGAQHGIRRWWIVSTSEVYGTPRRLPIDEDAPLSPGSFYGCLKAAADIYAVYRSEAEQVDCTILRFSNLYGVAADGTLPRTVLPLFAERILRDEPVLLHKSYRNSRDFLHVRDAAAAIWKAVENTKASGVINVGSGRETTLKDAALRLARLAKRRLHIDFRPDEGRFRRIVLDTRRARRVLGFRPRVTLKDGLREILNETARASK